jgi:hypothetical protein
LTGIPGILIRFNVCTNISNGSYVVLVRDSVGCIDTLQLCYSFIGKKYMDSKWIPPFVLSGTRFRYRPENLLIIYGAMVLGKEK